MTTVYVYVMNTMADWEIGYCIAIVPDITIKDIQVNKDNVLILPGSDSWSESENFRILEIAKRFLEVGGLVAAICGATVALANNGMMKNIDFQ